MNASHILLCHVLECLYWYNLYFCPQEHVVQKHNFFWHKFKVCTFSKSQYNSEEDPEVLREMAEIKMSCSLVNWKRFMRVAGLSILSHEDGEGGLNGLFRSVTTLCI